MPFTITSPAGDTITKQTWKEVAEFETIYPRPAGFEGSYSVLVQDAAAPSASPTSDVAITDHGFGLTSITAAGNRYIFTGTVDNRTIRQGNFQAYSKGAFSAWTGMWGKYVAPALVADSSAWVDQANFPANTTFYWDVTPDSSWPGVNGFLNLAHGNFDDSPGVITPLQIKNINTLAVDIDWTYSGNNGSGLLAECWLTTTAHASGALNDKVFEVAFFPKFSPSASTWVASLPSVGTFTSNGVTWNVSEAVSGSGNFPYFIAWLPSYAEFRGVLPYQDYFAFLKNEGRVTGDEWYNGNAFGVEPHTGAGNLLIKKFNITYTQGTPAWGPVERIRNGTFDSANYWNQVGYSGKSISAGKLHFASSPAYDGVTQDVTVVAGSYYELKYTVSAVAGGAAVYPTLVGGTSVSGAQRSTNGTFTERLLAKTGNTTLNFMLATAGSMDIDNVSLVGPYTTATIGGA